MKICLTEILQLQYELWFKVRSYLYVFREFNMKMLIEDEILGNTMQKQQRWNFDEYHAASAQF